MITIYNKTTCLSCQKALFYFKRKNIVHLEHNIGYKPIEEKKLIQLNDFSPNGILDFLNINNPKFLENLIDTSNIPRKYLIDFVVKNPDVLYLPIIVQTDKNDQYIKRLIVGYNKEKYKILLKEVNSSSSSTYINESKLFNGQSCCIDCDLLALRPNKIIINKQIKKQEDIIK